MLRLPAILEALLVISITCENPTFEFTAAPCQAGINTAKLSRFGCPSYELEITMLEGSQFSIGPIPEDIRPGVWRLTFDTECGCFQSYVHINLCTAPTFNSTHTATPDTETSIECCDP